VFARVWTGHWFWTLLFRGCFLGWSRRGRQRAFPLAGLTDQENLGHDLFYGRNDSGMNTGGPDGAPKNAGCVACHNNKGPGSPGDEPDQLYTDHAYHHLGLPPNYQIENFDPNNGDSGLSDHAIGADFPDMGDFVGHYKTPTLRNVDKRKNKKFIKAYMHNGYFKNLEDVVHFYNTSVALRDDVRSRSRCQRTPVRDWTWPGAIWSRRPASSGSSAPQVSRTIKFKVKRPCARTTSVALSKAAQAKAPTLPTSTSGNVG
jgi:hypothetical protein